MIIIKYEINIFLYNLIISFDILFELRVFFDFNLRIIFYIFIFIIRYVDSHSNLYSKFIIFFIFDFGGIEKRIYFNISIFFKDRRQFIRII